MVHENKVKHKIRKCIVLLVANEILHILIQIFECLCKKLHHNVQDENDVVEFQTRENMLTFFQVTKDK